MSGCGKGAQYTLIANVPYDTVRQDLVTEFRRFGRVELAMVVCDEASRHPHKEWTSTAGYAFVRFSKRQEAAAAIQAAGMGLVNIRGVRVRADWARKDSYAKRGRVSPQQGAPILGPLGVPDGIEALHSSLNKLSAESAKFVGTAAGWAAEAEQKPQQPKLPSSSDSTTHSSKRLMLPTSSSCTEETPLFGAHPEPDELYTPGCVFPSPSSHHSSVSDSLYAQLADYIIGTSKSEQTAANASSSTTGSLSPRSLTPPMEATETMASTALPGFDEMLSPCSRGLLAQALNDVVFTGSAQNTSSPMAFSQRLTRPEELLRAAVKCCDLDRTIDF